MSIKFLAAVTVAAASLGTGAFASVAVTPLPYGVAPPKNHYNVFDISNGTMVTGSSDINGATDVRSAIGYTSTRSEPEAVIFADGQTGPETINFATAAPVTIDGFNIVVASDGPGNGSIRTFGAVQLLGGLDGVTYTDLGSAILASDYNTTYGTNVLKVTSTFAPATYQYFEFVGTRGRTDTYFSGSRILSIEAVTGGVPEPASWAMMIVGFGLVGMSARRRVPQLARTTA